MDQKEFYELVKGRNARTFFNNVWVGLQDPSVDDSMDVDRKGGLIGNCRMWVGMYDRKILPEETMAGYRERDRESYDGVSRRIIRAINRWGLAI